MSKPRERGYRRLSVRLSEEELSFRRDEIAGCVLNIAKLKADRAAAAKVFNDEIKILEGTASTLATSIETRSVERDVECEVYFDIPRRKAVTIRLDNRQVIAVRDLSDQECQLVLGEELDELDADVYNALMDFERQMKEGEGENG